MTFLGLLAPPVLSAIFAAMWHSLPGQSAHVIFELAAYVIAARLYWRASRKQPQPVLADRALILGGAIFGAFAGSKLLHILEHLPALLAQHDSMQWLAGKSVLGGFLGGTLGVELAKRATSWRFSTGDAWVPALAFGLMIGRVGCQLSGTWDQTYGSPTGLPWAWDYGDGIGRHPTAIYEIPLAAVALAIASRARWRRFPGAAFALFLACYSLIRFGLEWLKPPFGDSVPGMLPVALYAGMTAIQWAAIVGIVWYLSLLAMRLRPTTAS